MKTAIAQIDLEIEVTCPYCDESNDVASELKNKLGFCTNKYINEQITCCECKESFRVTELKY